MRQLTRALVCFLAVTTGVLATGCNSMTMAPSSTENLDSIQQQLLGDMPLPKGARIDNNQSLILGSGSNWTGRIVLVTPEGPTSVFSFFRDQFPAAGWTGVSSIKAKTSVLVFIKLERTVTVELTDAGGLSNGTSVFLTAAPKGGTTLTPQETGRMPR